MNQIKRRRTGGVCIHNNKILLIHRINHARPSGEQEYYVIPDGGVGESETIPQTK